MRDKYYSDNRDLVKWAVLTHIARKYRLQVADNSTGSLLATRESPTAFQLHGKTSSRIK